MKRSPLPHSTPARAGTAVRPPDLEAAEEQFAAAFGHLDRLSAGPELLAQVRASLDQQAQDAGQQARDDGAVAYPSIIRSGRGGYGRVALAAAAAVLVGIAVFAFQGAPSRDGSADVVRTVGGGSSFGAPLVLEDPTLTLYHELETFDGVNLDAGDVLALGDE